MNGAAYTHSVCSVCLRRLPAELVRDGHEVRLKRSCPEHGETEALVWRGPPDFSTWREAGAGASCCEPAENPACPTECGLCSGHARQTCCMLLEVTQRCDLECPVCFAAASREAPDDASIGKIEGWYRRLLDVAPGCNVQLSGGEPTMRDDLPEVVALGRSLGHGFLQLNTNGLRLAAEPGYAKRLAEAGLTTVFLQFDGVDDAPYRALRGRSLAAVKERAVRRCAEAGLGVVLVPTVVRGVNLDRLGAILEFALEHAPAVRGVHVQPLALLGRHTAAGDPGADRVTLPDAMRALVDQSGDRLSLADLTPGDCEHALCSFSREYLRGDDGTLVPLAAPTDACGCGVPDARPRPPLAPAAKAAHVAVRWAAPGVATSAPAPPGERCPPAAEGPGDQWDAIIDGIRARTFSVSGMAFQDAWTLDLDRLRHCYLHVLADDGGVVPFCSRYLTAAPAGDAPVTTVAAASPRRTPLEPWVLWRAGVRDAEGLAAYQARALRATVARVREHSPFYADLLRDIEPGDLRSLDDLARLPLTTADDVRTQGKRLLCVPPGEVDRIVTLPTSGTTGEPKRIHFTTADQELTVDFFHHGMSVFVRSGQRVLILLPGERPGSVGDLLRRGLERMNVEGVVCGPVRDPDAALRELRSTRFDCVVGIPVQVLGLARRGAAAGAPIHLETVLLSTDQAPSSLVAAVEEAWGCRVFDHYGTTEMGLGGGVECDALDGYHLREADLLFEVVDPGSGEQVPDGEYGEVVFTTLTREAMPLVRYRTGDRGRFLTSPCPCGTALRRIERVRSRFSGRILLQAGGTVDQAVVDEVLFALPAVLDVRAVLRREGPVDMLDVDVLAPGAGPGLLRRAAAALEQTPALAPGVRTGRLLIDAAVVSAPWPQGVGTAKRTLVESDQRRGGTT